MKLRITVAVEVEIREDLTVPEGSDDFFALPDGTELHPLLAFEKYNDAEGRTEVSWKLHEWEEMGIRLVDYDTITIEEV